MYHLEGNPTGPEHTNTLFSELVKTTTSKCRAWLKRMEALQQAGSRPSVSRSSTQHSVPRSKE